MPQKNNYAGMQNFITIILCTEMMMMMMLIVSWHLRKTLTLVVATRGKT